MCNQHVYEESNLYKIRHSLAHVMAQAVLERFPNGKIAIGPPIEDGFYYDFDLPRALTPDDLSAIEKRMRQIVKKRHRFSRRELSADEAKSHFADQPYKLALIADLEAGNLNEDSNPVSLDQAPIISTYKQDAFEDLCKGPHVENLGQIDPKAFKLLNVAGAYWRGDENQPQLQRIYGTAWETPEQLAEYLHRLEEAKKRDHRRIGRELDLFSFNPDSLGQGLVLWHPKGALMRHLIEDHCKRKHLANGYELAYTPHIGNSELWAKSGHLDFYKEDMYPPIEAEGQDYYLKPMNCPFHILIYKSAKRSYREFPFRIAEWGTVYRYERSGSLHGILRPRGFTQDDAHHFCRADQMPEEIDFALNFSLEILRDFGLSDIEAFLSTEPESKAIGEKNAWRAAEEALEAALQRANVPYEIDAGGGAFYGPKIDINVKDAIGRKWQLSTIQFDFNLPARFNMRYIGPDGQEHQPYMIHRALLGSLERFFGVFVEHYAGAFPIWLSPIQAIILPVADRHGDYAQQVATQLKAADLRVEVDDSGDRLGNKIRKAQAQKIPYMLIVGDQEADTDQVSVRLRDGNDLGAVSIDKFVGLAQQAIQAKHV